MGVSISKGVKLSEESQPANPETIKRCEIINIICGIFIMCAATGVGIWITYSASFLPASVQVVGLIGLPVVGSMGFVQIMLGVNSCLDRKSKAKTIAENLERV